MADDFNLRDVTSVGVLLQEKGEDPWSTAVEPAAVPTRPVAKRRPWSAE